MKGSSTKVKYIMIGGFLGAGKTTSILQLAKNLHSKGFRVGLISNDQGQGLVDTSNMKAHGFAVEEIPGGCFCCRFNSLVEASEKLTQFNQPEYFIAEPVGSCTDLVATVFYPLRRMYQDQFEVKPLSVVLDPLRAERIFGLEKGRSFSHKVLYIYQKQLEEADLLLINKVDLLNEERLERLRNTLEHQYPNKKIMVSSARSGEGLELWFDWFETAQSAGGPAMSIDYPTYAEGEALLGWLNATIEISCDPKIDGNAMIHSLADHLRQQLASAHIEIAHLKMTLEPIPSVTGEIAVLSVVSSQLCPELSLRLPEPISRAQLIVNLRAERSPQDLEQALRLSLEHLQNANSSSQLKLEHLEAFKPGYPAPVHRMTHDQGSLD